MVTYLAVVTILAWSTGTCQPWLPVTHHYLAAMVIYMYMYSRYHLYQATMVT